MICFLFQGGSFLQFLKLVTASALAAKHLLFSQNFGKYAIVSLLSNPDLNSRLKITTQLSTFPWL